MKQKSLTYGTAATFALGITLLTHILFVIMFFFGRDAVYPSGRPPRPEHDFDIYRLMISFVVNFVFAFAMYILNFAILKSNIREKDKTAAALGASVAATFILSYLLTSAQMTVLDFGPHPMRAIRGGMVRDAFISVIVIFSSQIMYLSQKRQQMALENETLLAENAKTRYEALKNQIDPHFLFNTLNTLNSMIQINPEKAQEYVQKLSAVFRYTIQNKEVITLEDEIKFTKDYCALMQIRYGGSLKFDFRIAEQYKNYLIVPLSVQTLVENAIKHNVITKRDPLVISIFTSDDDTITVSNPLRVKKEPEAGEGIGLANLAERFRLKWQRGIEVKCADNTFTVTLPLIKA